jgi:uncharacterized membrane protein YkoI
MRAAQRWTMSLGALLLAGVAGPAAAANGARYGLRAPDGAGLAPGLIDASAAAYADAGGIPRERLIDMVQRRFNARVVRVNQVESGGRRVYEMRLMSEQRVWNVRVDAATGQVLDGG